MHGFVHVVAAAVVDDGGNVLIQRRPRGVHLSGLWEFPGGKLEPDEDPRAALVRELHEELGIHALDATPLIAVRHDYGDKRVLLDVWRLRRWEGEPKAREGQPMRWVRPEELAGYDFPAADRPVLRALSLPETCLVTPAPGDDTDAWLRALTRAVSDGVSLVQVRAPELPRCALLSLCEAAIGCCGNAARVVVNGDASLALQAGAHGVHLDSRRLWQTRTRPLASGMLVGASCHDAADLARAAALDADFALLGPVAATATHPGAVPLGWGAFEALAARALLPVYALGGLAPDDVGTALRRGGQGIAAIRGLWPSSRTCTVK